MAFSLGQRSDSADALATGSPSAAGWRPSPWQFKLFHKLALIVALSGLPAVVLGYLFITEGHKATETAEKERQGLAYLSEAWMLFDATIRSQNPDTALARVADAGKRYDEELRTGSYREAVAAAARQGGPVAIDASRDFMQRVADNSGLSVHSNLSTLQAITIFTTRIPEVAAAAAVVAYRQPGTTASEMADVMQFMRTNRLLAASMGATDALNFEPELAARFARSEAAVNTAAQKLAELAADRANRADRTTLIARQQEFQSALSSFWVTGVEALDRLMLTRIDYLRGQLSNDLWIAAGVALLLIALIWLVSHSIAGRLAILGRAMELMRQGKLDGEMPQIRKRDEIGAMARAVEDFRGGLIAKRKVDEALIRNKQELEQQNLWFDSALSNMSQGLALFDRDGRLIVANARLAEVYGIDPNSFRPGDSHRDMTGRMLAGSLFAGSTADAIRSGNHPLSISGSVSDAFVELSDGRVLFVAKRAMPGGGWVSTHEDITERRQAEAKMAHMAHHDALTELPNRVLFRERLEEVASRVAPGKWAAVLCLDLDNFKSVNDTLGHPVGDLLLKAVADRLRATIRDSAMVARLSGDEFAIVEPLIDSPEAAAALAQRFIAVVAKPFEIEGHHIVIGTSIGIAIAPTDGTHPDQLLKNADMALYRAKGDGRGTHRFFEREMDARLQSRRLLELDIRKALTAGEFELHYQAQVNLARDQVTGFEALIRWRHPARGLVPPVEFIPLAEETGLIAPIGEWVIRTACLEGSRWPNGIRIAVNLSPVQFRSRNLVPTVVNALAMSGLDPSRLELEITESVLLENTDATLATLHQLRDLGVRISMDDFGTGYSSLSYLRAFPFDKIKIDRSFTRDIETTPDSAAIVRAVASLGASLGITTTAEGVETERQLEIVRGEGCTEVQGHVFSVALPSEEVWDLLRRFDQDSATRVA